MNIYKLKKLHEQAPNDYKKTLGKLLDEKEINPMEVSMQELAFEFLGRDYKSVLKEMTNYNLFSMAQNLQEGPSGGVVLPSHFSNISAFSDSVSGLISVMIMDAYQSPMFIGDQFVDERQSRVQGGKMIGMTNDGQPDPDQDLLDGEPYPNVGLRETWVDIPDNKRRGNVIEVNQKTFIYDLTDLLQSQAQNAGFATRRSKEIEIADLVWGARRPIVVKAMPRRHTELRQLLHPIIS